MGSFWSRRVKRRVEIFLARCYKCKNDNPNREEFFKSNPFGSIDSNWIDSLNFLFDEIENNDTLTFNTFEEYWEYKLIYFYKPIDGQTTQQVLEAWGMDSQMLRQLVMTQPFDEVKELFEERIEAQKLLQ